MNLRAATGEDCAFVFELHNDPAVRAVSIRTELIEWEDHERWFADRIDHPAEPILVVEEQGERLGVVRFAGADTGEATVSIALAEAARGRGLGRRALGAGLTRLFDTTEVQRVVAWVRPDNGGSRRAFAAAGFAPVGFDEQEGIRLERFERRRLAVTLRCDGAAQIGWGHVMRCLALARQLADLGAPCTFLCRELDPELVQRIQRAGHDLARVEGDEVTALREQSGDIVVVDHYGFGTPELDALEGQAFRVVVDDLADRSLRCELVLNANPTVDGPRPLDYSGWSYDHALFGPQHALLTKPAVEPEGPPCVLVTLGGGAASERAAALAARIAEVTDLPVEVGAGLPSLVPLLSRACLAVSSAGTTVFELAAFGVPGLLLPVVDNQLPGAEAWAATGAYEWLRTEDDAPTRVRALLTDPTELTRRSRLAQTLCDGRGAARAAAAILAAASH